MRDSLQGVGTGAGDAPTACWAPCSTSPRLDGGGLHPQPGNFSLHRLFERLAVEYGSIAETQGLSLRVQPTRLAVHSDVMLLETVLRNLLSNAIKYTASGRILMGARRRGDCVSIEVWDTGMVSPRCTWTRSSREFGARRIQRHQGQHGARAVHCAANLPPAGH